MDPFTITRQTITFLGVLAVLELAIVLVFPAVSVLLGAVAAVLLTFVWMKAGIRTRKWLWFNPVAVPLSQFEGAIALSAALMFAAGIFVTGYEAIRYASGGRDLLTGYAFRHLRPGPETSRPVSTRAFNYSDPAMQQQFKDELAKAGNPFTLDTRDGKEYVVWTPEHNAAVDEIEGKIREGPASGGRNVHFGDPATQQAFKDWLTERGIAYEITTMRGEEFVLWKEGSEDLSKQFLKEYSPPCDRDTAASASKTGEKKPC